MNPPQGVRRWQRPDLEEESRAFYQVCEDYARKENQYRLAKSKAYLGSEGTVDARKAYVDQVCERERLDCHIADGLKDASKERIRALLAILNSYQTIAAFEREEMRLAR